MNEKQTGGQAFPRSTDAFAVSRGDGGGANYKIRTEQGMTLRDYFAAKAMQGILFECLETEDTAKFAYEMADAMLKAREQ